MNVADYSEMLDSTELVADGNGNSRADIVKRTIQTKGRPNLDISESDAYLNGLPAENVNITYSGCNVINCVPTAFTDDAPKFSTRSTTFNNCKFNTYEIQKDTMVVEGRFNKGNGSAMSALDTRVIGAKPDDLVNLVDVGLAQAGMPGRGMFDAAMARSQSRVSRGASGPDFADKLMALSQRISSYQDKESRSIENNITGLMDQIYGGSLNSVQRPTPEDIDRLELLDSNIRVVALNAIADSIYDIIGSATEIEEFGFLRDYIEMYYGLVDQGLRYKALFEYMRLSISALNTTLGFSGNMTVTDVRDMILQIGQLNVYYATAMNENIPTEGSALDLNSVTNIHSSILNLISSTVKFNLVTASSFDSVEDSYSSIQYQVDTAITSNPNDGIKAALDALNTKLQGVFSEFDIDNLKEYSFDYEISRIDKEFDDANQSYANIFEDLDRLWCSYLAMESGERDTYYPTHMPLMDSVFEKYVEFVMLGLKRKCINRSLDSYNSLFRMGQTFVMLTDSASGSLEAYYDFINTFINADSYRNALVRMEPNYQTIYVDLGITGEVSQQLARIVGNIPGLPPVSPPTEFTVDQLHDKFIAIWDFIPDLRPSSELTDPSLNRMNMFYDAVTKELIIRWTVPYETYTKKSLGVVLRDATNSTSSTVDIETYVINHLKHGWISVHDYSMVAFRSQGSFLNGFSFTGGDDTTAIKNSDFTGVGNEISLVTLESGNYKLDGCRADVLEISSSVVSGENCAIKSTTASTSSTVSIDGGTFGTGDATEHLVYYNVETKKFYSDTKTDTTAMSDSVAKLWASAIRKYGCIVEAGTVSEEEFFGLDGEQVQYKSMIIGFTPIVSGSTNVTVPLDTFADEVKYLKITMPSVYYQIGTIAVGRMCNVSVSNANLSNAVVTQGPESRFKITGCTGNFPATRHFERFNLYSMTTNTIIPALASDELNQVYSNVQISDPALQYRGLSSTPIMTHSTNSPPQLEQQSLYDQYRAHFVCSDCEFNSSTVDHRILNSQTLPWYASTYYNNTAVTGTGATLELMQSSFLRCSWNGTELYVIQGVADLVSCNSTAPLNLAQGASIVNCTLASIELNQNIRRIAWVTGGVRAAPMQILKSDIGNITIGSQSCVNISGNGPTGIQSKFYHSHQEPTMFDINCHVGSTIQLGEHIFPYPLRPNDTLTTGVIGINTSEIRFTDREVEFSPIEYQSTYNNLLQVEFTRCKARLMTEASTSKALVSYRFVDSEIMSNTDIDVNYAFMYAERTKNAFARLEVINHTGHVLPTNVLIDCKRPTLRFLETKVHKRSGEISALITAKAASLNNVTRATVNTDSLATYLRDCTDVNLLQVSTAAACGAFSQKYICTSATSSELRFQNGHITASFNVTPATTNAVMPVVLDSCNVVQDINTSTFASEPVVLVYTGECTSVMAIDNTAIRSTFSSALVDASTVYVGYNSAVNRDAYQYLTHNTVFRSCNIVVDDVVYGINSEDEVSNATDIAPTLRFANNHFVSCKFTNTKLRTHSVLNPRLKTGDFNLMNPSQTALSMPTDSLPARLYNHVSLADFYTPTVESTADATDSYVPTNYTN